MKRLKFLCMVAAIGAAQLAKGQEKPKIDIWNPPMVAGIQTLNIGDVVPDFKMKLFNSDKKEVNLSDYKDQLLILDFGNTGCAGCIAALPEMNRLTKQFAGKLQIFWVTPEYQEDIAAFWNRKGNKYTQGNALSVVVQDQIARSYFKHKSWPHEAWVYKGKLVALTGGDFVDAKNIEKVLSGKAIDWPVKNDFYVFDAQKEQLFKSDKVSYVAVGGYKKGVNSDGLTGGSGIVRDSVKKTVRLYFINQPIYTSYQMFLMHANKPQELVKPSFSPLPGANETLFKVSEPFKYRYYEKKSGYQQEFVRNHAICFEMQLPDRGQTGEELYGLAKQKLDSLLGLNVGWQKRKEKVLVLVRTTQTDALKSKAKVVGTPAEYENGIDPHHKVVGMRHQFRDYKLRNLVWLLNQQEENPYVFDETGYQEGVDMDLNFKDWTDIAAIRKGLRAYGLDLKEEERLIDRFVIEEVKENSKSKE